MVQERNQPSPARFTLYQVTADREALNRQVPPPPGDRIPVEIEPFPIDKYTPMVDDIGWELRSIW